MGQRKSFSCEFGGVSLGDQVARIGVHADKTVMDPIEADQFLAGRRCTVSIELPEGDAPGQRRIKGFEPPRIIATSDIKRYSGSDKAWGFGLAFNLSEIDSGVLAQFAKRSGRIDIEVLGNAGAEEPAPGPSPKTAPAPGQQQLPGVKEPAGFERPRDEPTPAAGKDGQKPPRKRAVKKS